ncbi:MAG: metal-dependent hydrolase [Bacteroidetes bacterium]|nr:MAG: metal-dependent hydrolase [Bacteroidota bacterium]
MKVTFYGHASFVVETAGKTLVFDPFITPNEKASHVDISAIRADYILLSHGHADHVADVEAIARASNAKVISNFEVVSWFGQKGIEGHPMNHGGKWRFDFGTVKYVNAVHSSSMPDGSYGGNPGGFVVWNDEGCFYFAGDTALTEDMKLIPMTCPRLDFAILPIGDNFTMDAADAALAAEFVQCDHVIGCHYDTFPYIEIDHEAARAAFAKRGKKLTLLAIGESVEF